MDDQDILSRIHALVDEEHKLRESTADHGEDERARVAALERDLDQCWDLLRQRRAKADAGEDPGDADARPISQVEGYRQ